MTMALKTNYSIAREKKRREVYDEYRRLVARPENMKSAIVQVLMKKFNISYSTVYAIIKEKEAQDADA